MKNKHWKMTILFRDKKCSERGENIIKVYKCKTNGELESK